MIEGRTSAPCGKAEEVDPMKEEGGSLVDAGGCLVCSRKRDSLPWFCSSADGSLSSPITQLQHPYHDMKYVHLDLDVRLMQCPWCSWEEERKVKPLIENLRGKVKTLRGSRTSHIGLAMMHRLLPRPDVSRIDPHWFFLGTFYPL